MADAVRIGLVGLGKIARDQHVPAIRANPRFELAATADPAGALEGTPAFPDLATLLAARPAIDAVAICTPPQVRGRLARQAIAAGKHVMLEKPPAATLAGVADLIRRAESANVTLFTAWHSRFAPMVEPARRWLADRRIVAGRIDWREDVRRWHPGQTWLWAAGGLGVFDPGINAFDPDRAFVRADQGRLRAPVGARERADADRRQTACGHRLRLARGGAALTIDDEREQLGAETEYGGVYDRFAALIAAGGREADASPLRLVADTLLVAETERVPAFVDDAHHHVA